jgi:hypothetical protein
MKKIFLLVAFALAAIFIAAYYFKIRNEKLKKHLTGKVIF